MAKQKNTEAMTTIPVSVKTAAALRKLGDMDDTYETVVQRLLKNNCKLHEKKEGPEEDESVSRGISH